MALETLIRSQQEAADILDVPFGELHAMQEPRVDDLGKIAVTGVEPFPAYRVHTGPEGLISKGGTRMYDYGSPEAAVAGATELSAEMWPKIWIRSQGTPSNEGLQPTPGAGIQPEQYFAAPKADYQDLWCGGKTVFLVNPHTLSPAQKQESAVRYAEAMEEAGLADAFVTVPAGDIGFNGLADTYASAVRERNTDYAYWQATITGKSPDMGGLGFRTNATGYGMYVSLRTLMEKGKGDDVVSVTVQGGGNVGSWFMHYAAQDSRMRVGGFSELGGMLSTKHPGGLIITEEMVKEIGDNPKFTGDKLGAMARAIQANQPGIELTYSANPNDILEYPTDYFVPAAAPNVINESNMRTLGARIGIAEAANGPTTALAHSFLTKRGLVVLPDFMANGAGVDGSIIEWKANVRQAKYKEERPTDDAVKGQLNRRTADLIERTLYAAREMGTRDLRVAASGLFIAQLFPKQGLRLAA